MAWPLRNTEISYILNFSMTKFVKSFSKGQITVPKEMREELGIGDDFWLKLWIEGGKLVAEPAESQPKLSPKKYAETLKTIKGGWFSLNDHKKFQEEFEDHFKKSEL